MGRITQNLQVPRVVSTEREIFINTRPDTVAVEEPLEIRVNGARLTTTMRTPGNDIELIHGLLLAEGLITDAAEVATARYCAGATGPDNQNTYNLLEVDVTPATVPDPLGAGASCGVSGSSTIDQLLQRKRWPIAPLTPDPRAVVELPGKLRAQQKLLARTGGVHGAGLATATGELLAVREDVGLHNAVDKVLGSMLLAGRLPLSGTVLVLSSGASSELVHRATMAGASGVVAVGAVTSLAVEAARTAGIFLAGLVGDGKFNLYSGEVS